MDWMETNSSTIARFRYISETNVLEIEFKKSGVYQYFDVPESILEEMKGAASLGKFFAQNIKGVFRYARA